MAETTLILYDEHGNRVAEKPLVTPTSMTDDELRAMLMALVVEAEGRGLDRKMTRWRIPRLGMARDVYLTIPSVDPHQVKLVEAAAATHGIRLERE